MSALAHSMSVAATSNASFTWNSMPLPTYCTAYPQSEYQPTGPYFAVCDDAFFNIIGYSPSVDLKIEKDWPFAHEAAVYIPTQDAIYMTSNLLTTNVSVADNGGHIIKIGKVSRSAGNYTYTEIQPSPYISMGNGGTKYFNNSILFCAQGSKSQPGGIVQMESYPPYDTKTLISSYYGKEFNSLNDVVVHPDGSIWFTDPIYGFEQAYRTTPVLRQQVYRFDPKTGYVRAVADNFDRPNGLVFSPDYKTLYVTDTGYGNGNGSVDPLLPSTIYAFDVIERSGSQFLGNRREFAYVVEGIPDGIKVDAQGNVYSGCGDGIHVWTPGATLLGVIRIPGGAAQFNFGHAGELFILANNKFYVAQISPLVRGAQES